MEIGEVVERGWAEQRWACEEVVWSGSDDAIP